MEPEQIAELRDHSMHVIFEYMVSQGYIPQNIAINKVADYVCDDGNYTPIYYDQAGGAHRDLRIDKDDYEKFLIDYQP